MADRREEATIRTDRPSTPHASTLTVRDVLGLDEVRAGRPEVLVGDAALDVAVRWVHVSDHPDVARLLEGGELLLTTGSGWPEEPDALADLIDELVDAGVAGVVLELGTHYRWVPRVVEDAARARGLALVTLPGEVRFVALTEAVHRAIIAEQIAALRARDEVRERFTSLALRGAPADFVVQQLAQTLGAPVVLENLAHEVIAAEVPPAVEAELFADWELRSRAAHRRARDAGGEPDAEWLIVPVEARGIRWGSLIALAGPAHPAGRLSVLEQGAIALALGRLADESDEWGRIGRRRLVDALLSGRYSGTDGAVARLTAGGFPVVGRKLYGLVLSRAAVVPDAAEAAARTVGSGARSGTGVGGGVGGRTGAAAGVALVGPAPSGVASPAAAILLSLPEDAVFDDAAALAFARASAQPADRAVLSVGSAASGLDAALISLQEAVDLARARTDARGPQLRRTENRPLMRLVTTLRDDHRLLEHGERMLAPLIEYDLARGGDLLDVLGAMLAHPSNRTAAASASHLSRSVFYQRIALIEDLLGTDLDDGETQTALHLALLVRRSAGR
jgi:purine catabolism regulator